jgi:hypothetical protein
MFRNRPGFLVPTFAAALGFASCGSVPKSDGVSSIRFDPNPAAFSGGVCVSSARIQEIAGNSVNLLSVTAVFTDGNGTRGEFVFDADRLSSILDSQTIPAHGTVTGSFSFDLAAKGLTAPSDGTVVAVGAGNGTAVTHFVGTIRCEEKTPS